MICWLKTPNHEIQLFSFNKRSQSHLSWRLEFTRPAIVYMPWSTVNEKFDTLKKYVGNGYERGYVMS